MMRRRTAGWMLAAFGSWLAVASAQGLESEIPATLQKMADTERAFARRAVETTIRGAFIDFFADDAISFEPDPGPARERLRASTRPQPPGFQLLWEPRLGDIAESGDLGFLTGPAESILPGQPTRYTNYFSVWKRQADGEYRVILDVGVATPEKPEFAPGLTRARTQSTYRTQAPQTQEPGAQKAQTPAPGPRMAQMTQTQAPGPQMTQMTQTQAPGPRMAQMTQTQAPGPQMTQMAQTQTPAAQMAQTELAAADERLADDIAARGVRAGYAAALHPDARVMRTGVMPMTSRDAAVAWLTSEVASMSAESLKAETTASGELGYTWGRFSLKTSKGADQAGYYIRVWTRQVSGVWQIAADVTTPPK